MSYRIQPMDQTSHLLSYLREKIIHGGQRKEDTLEWSEADATTISYPKVGVVPGVLARKLKKSSGAMYGGVPNKQTHMSVSVKAKHTSRFFSPQNDVASDNLLSLLATPKSAENEQRR